MHSRPLNDGNGRRRSVARASIRSAKSPDVWVNPTGFRGVSHGTSSAVVSQPYGYQGRPNPVVKAQRMNVGTVIFGPIRTGPPAAEVKMAGRSGRSIRQRRRRATVRDRDSGCLSGMPRDLYGDHREEVDGPRQGAWSVSDSQLGQSRRESRMTRNRHVRFGRGRAETRRAQRKVRRTPTSHRKAA